MNRYLKDYILFIYRTLLIKKMIKFPENVIYHSLFVILIFVLLVVITPMYSYSQDTGNIINPNEQQVDDLLSGFIQETKENVNATSK